MNFINKKNKKRYRADELFYQIGKVFWLPFSAAGFWFAYTGYGRYGEMISCAIRKMCGLPCPGCGGTRAFFYLFQGNFRESLRLNPIVIYGVLAYLHFMLLYFMRKHTRACPGSRKMIHVEYYAYGAIFVLLAQWIYKLARIFYHLL